MVVAVMIRMDEQWELIMEGGEGGRRFGLSGRESEF